MVHSDDLEKHSRLIRRSRRSYTHGISILTKKSKLEDSNLWVWKTSKASNLLMSMTANIHLFEIPQQTSKLEFLQNFFRENDWIDKKKTFPDGQLMFVMTNLGWGQATQVWDIDFGILMHLSKSITCEKSKVKHMIDLKYKLLYNCFIL